MRFPVLLSLLSLTGCISQTTTEHLPSTSANSANPNGAIVDKPTVVATPDDQSRPKPLPKYICPMHPEVTSDKPGTCPKCGMTLVPLKGVIDGNQ